ncbi:uncharacterized protein [Aristolochia californica]|uniref:uncharacterized protein n=1 Tax=Aristolochia californica TaxID=171875 RepID=UPI0035D99B7E
MVIFQETLPTKRFVNGSQYSVVNVKILEHFLFGAQTRCGLTLSSTNWNEFSPHYLVHKKTNVSVKRLDLKRDYTVSSAQPKTGGKVIPRATAQLLPRPERKNFSSVAILLFLSLCLRLRQFFSPHLLPLVFALSAPSAFSAFSRFHCRLPLVSLGFALPSPSFGLPLFSLSSSLSLLSLALLFPPPPLIFFDLTYYGFDILRFSTFRRRFLRLGLDFPIWRWFSPNFRSTSQVTPQLQGMGSSRRIVSRIIRVLTNDGVYDMSAICSEQVRLFSTACGFGNDVLVPPL